MTTMTEAAVSLGIQTLPTAQALSDVAQERERQEAIGLAKRAEGIDWRSCADPAMAGGDGTRFLVLGEEVGEVANAVLEAGYGNATKTEIELREELIQVAAVAVAWVEAIDARTARTFDVDPDWLDLGGEA